MSSLKVPRRKLYFRSRELRREQKSGGLRQAGHFLFNAETGMGAGEVPLVLFKLHVRCMLFSLDSQAIHLYCNA